MSWHTRCTQSKKEDGSEAAENTTKDQKRWQKERRPCASECRVGGLEGCGRLGMTEGAWDVNVKKEADREEDKGL